MAQSNTPFTDTIFYAPVMGLSCGILSLVFLWMLFQVKAEWDCQFQDSCRILKKLSVTSVDPGEFPRLELLTSMGLMGSKSSSSKLSAAELKAILEK